MRSAEVVLAVGRQRRPLRAAGAHAVFLVAVFLAGGATAHAPGVGLAQSGGASGGGALPEPQPPVAVGGAPPATSVGDALRAASGGSDFLGGAPALAGWELSDLQPPLPAPSPFDAAADSGAPVPYSKDEFPGWLRDLRRAEVITIGAFPITLLFSSLGYQVYRSITGVKTQITQPEQIGVLLTGVGLAATVALADFILGKIQRPPKQQEAP